jgi:hypothetical protein
MFNRLWHAEFEIIRAIARGQGILVVEDKIEGPHIVIGDADAIMADLVDYFGPTAGWSARGVTLAPASELDLRKFLAGCEDIREMDVVEAVDAVDDLLDRRTAARRRRAIA